MKLAVLLALLLAGSVADVRAGTPQGVATWYDAPSPQDAAAGPALRAALGDWRGRWVYVCHGDACVATRLTDWCACRDRNGQPTLLDLDDKAFAKLAPLSRGVVEVTITDVALPATDTEDPT